MKKLIFVLIIFVFILSSCSNSDNSIKQRETNELGEGSRVLEGCIFKTAEEKYGIHKEGKIILPATYEEFKRVGELGGKMFYALGFKDGTKRCIEWNDDGTVIGTTETERTLYEIFDSDGNMLLTFPVDDFSRSTPKKLCVTLEGNYYIYDFSDDGEITEECIHEKGKTGRTVFGFDEIEYNYNASGFGTFIGLADSEGNTVLPEIYGYIIPVLDDRIIAFTHSAMVGYTAYRLYDSECNLLCENYSYIDFYPIDREDYEKGFVGVAKIDYPEHQSPLICRDENGEILPGGLWFVDKNGNALSERFDIDMIDIEFSAEHKLAIVKDVNGETTEIPIGDYIIEKDW